ncbi:hypothetical protein ACS6GB_12705 [Enterobacter hormaechei subsp. xiangfangensis]|nr:MULTISPECIES: hypothetical protein [Enterobacter]MCE1213076.1 hypothetical protein [Enterobacter hormaechei]MCM6967315.1 hypothetical protein [Enterobacter hormaechei]MCM7034314.1 hypothetical protein [Enterobacter hormaechei]MCM7551697.1 hypothetical protein [Enterobacter hormaechei]MCM8276577.1 hypothetical protein [Enterobacter hormaechei]
MNLGVLASKEFDTTDDEISQHCPMVGI